VRIHLAARLVLEYRLTFEEMLGELPIRGLTADALELHWAGAKRLAAAYLAAQFLASEGEVEVGWRGFLTSVLPDEPDHISADRQELLRAYRGEIARLAVLRGAPPVPAGFAGQDRPRLRRRLPDRPIGPTSPAGSASFPSIEWRRGRGALRAAAGCLR
jgi:hypothetical protein